MMLSLRAQHIWAPEQIPEYDFIVAQVATSTSDYNKLREDGVLTRTQSITWVDNYSVEEGDYVRILPPFQDYDYPKGIGRITELDYSLPEEAFVKVTIRIIKYIEYPRYDT